MSEPNLPLLSVRGEARRTVSPDSVSLLCGLSVSAGSKPDALREATMRLDALTGDLRRLGGVALGPDSERAALTWSTYSTTTHLEREHEPRTGQFALTGGVTAVVAVTVTVRDFSLLDQLGALLAGHEALAINQTVWNVDADNSAWPMVRAAAIDAAIRKARDYAGALGGSLLQVLHVADIGLLDGGSRSAAPVFSSAAVTKAALATGQPDVPSLDPVPQELTAAIEARFIMTSIAIAKE